MILSASPACKSYSWLCLNRQVFCCSPQPLVSIGRRCAIRR